MNQWLPGTRGSDTFFFWGNENVIKIGRAIVVNILNSTEKYRIVLF